MADLSYLESPTGEKHINSEQKFQVKSVGGRVVTLYFGGIHSASGDRNTFAMKHFLRPTKKVGGPDQAIKAEKRLAHRLDHSGTKADNPYQGAKAGNQAYMQTRKDKYGSACAFHGVAGGPETASNSVIDLSILNFDTVLYEIAKALEQANWDRNIKGNQHVNITFSKPCVFTVTATKNPPGNPWTFAHSAPTNVVRVTGRRTSDTVYEIYHLG